MTRRSQPRAGVRFWLLGIAALLVLLFVPRLSAQGAAGTILGPVNNGLEDITEAYHQGGSVQVTVLAENKTKLDRQAVVRLHCDNPLGTVYQTTKNGSQTTFLGLSVCKYGLEISAAGYLTTDKQIEVAGLTDTLQLDVTLKKDAAAINLDATGITDALMPSRASKDTAAAVADLKSSNLKDARKKLNSAYRLAPESSRVNFLMGYLFFEQKDYDQAQTYLNHAVTLSPSDAQALALLGRVELLRGQYEPAKATLERAVVANPNDWMTHNLLGSVDLKLKQYEKAREQAQLAIDLGKGDASAARLVLGESQADLGHTAEAIQTLKAFLVVAPDNPQAPQVQQFISQLEQRVASAPKAAMLNTVVGAPVAAGDPDPLADTSEPELSVAWQPPGVDESKPSVAAGVTCPTQEVLGKTGERVQELVDDVGRFAAIEDLLHERLDNQGNPITRETRKFDYAAYISQPRPGVLLVDEFRTERYGIDTLPDQIATSGFPALALIFHPTMQPDYTMVCEGLGEWKGQATWLVHFRARDDRPSHIQDYVVGTHTYPIRLKGRAWVTADKFQIVRIESELISPLKGIGFLAEHQIAEYGPVYFEKKKVQLWLPKTAEVYLDFHRHRYYRRHSFDKFMLFSVDSTDKVNTAAKTPPGPGSTSPHKRKHWHA
ncbi:MAG: tetratricopeptide repeat protein [Terriglobales bacterium]